MMALVNGFGQHAALAPQRVMGFEGFQVSAANYKQWFVRLPRLDM